MKGNHSRWDKLNHISVDCIQSTTTRGNIHGSTISDQGLLIDQREKKNAAYMQRSLQDSYRTEKLKASLTLWSFDKIHYINIYWLCRMPIYQYRWKMDCTTVAALVGRNMLMLAIEWSDVWDQQMPSCVTCPEHPWRKLAVACLCRRRLSFWLPWSSWLALTELRWGKTA